jgi:type IV fimbrial biogenesis protein FimT
MVHFRSSRFGKMLGVTLVELLVVFAVLALLSFIAVPSFTRLIDSTRVSTATGLLHNALLYTRTEAIKRNTNVIICRSENADSPAPSCAPGSALTGWGTGWIVYVDRDGNSRYSTGDELLRTQSALFLTPTQGAILPNPHRNAITYRVTGQTFGSFVQFSVNQASHRGEVGINRYICIAAGGRARVDFSECN